MLDFLLKKPAKPVDGGPVLVLLHGRGSDMRDLQGLAPVLPENGTLVTPQAPHPGERWGYGPGWAWYEYKGYGEADGPSMRESLQLLEEFLDGLPQRIGFQPGPLVLGGFSQGGTMSLAFALTRPGAVDGVVVLSGFLASEEAIGAGPAAMLSAPEGEGHPPLFWAHGTQDPSVPFTLAVEGRRRLREAGIEMDVRDYPMGHWVTPEEMMDLRGWLGASVPGWPNGKDG
jgi:phospholipase/carboxylesterase